MRSILKFLNLHAYPPDSGMARLQCLFYAAIGGVVLWALGAFK